MKIQIIQTPKTSDFNTELIKKLGTEHYDFSTIDLVKNATTFIQKIEEKSVVIIFITNEILKKIHRKKWQTLSHQHKTGSIKVLPILVEKTSWFYTPYAANFPIFPADKTAVELTQIDNLVVEINDYLNNSDSKTEQTEEVENIEASENPLLSKADIDAVTWNKPSVVATDYRKDIRIQALLEAGEEAEENKDWSTALNHYKEALNIADKQTTRITIGEKIIFCDGRIDAKRFVAKGKKAYQQGYFDTALDYFNQAYAITETESIQKAIKQVETKKRDTELKNKEKSSRQAKLYIVLGVIIFAILVLFLVKFLSKPKMIEVNEATISDYPMVLVQGGTFVMGSDNEFDQSPEHEVALNSFYIGQYEVTVEWYDLYCQKQSLEFVNLSSNSIRGQRALTNVSWFNAIQFANWMSKKDGYTAAYIIVGQNVLIDETANGYQLPTEAQWEFAASGGNNSKNYLYSGSHFLNEVSWHSINSQGGIHTIGQKKPNELGIYDMSGNAWEWCWDFYDEAGYANHEATNPKGPKYGEYRVIRGGSWFSRDTYLRVKNRSMEKDWTKDVDLGFRLVRPVTGIQN